MLIRAREESCIPRHVLKMNLENTPTRSITLSPRQRHCLQMLADGHTASSIAFRLGISVRMVRGHLQKAREKLGANSSTQAVRLALKRGLLD